VGAFKKEGGKGQAGKAYLPKEALKLLKGKREVLRNGLLEGKLSRG